MTNDSPYSNNRNTIHCKTPRHFLLDKIILTEHLYYELVITIALTAYIFNLLFVLTQYTLSAGFILHYRTLDFMNTYLYFDLVCGQNCFKNIPFQVLIGLC